MFCIITDKYPFKKHIYGPDIYMTGGDKAALFISTPVWYNIPDKIKDPRTERESDKSKCFQRCSIWL